MHLGKNIKTVWFIWQIAIKSEIGLDTAIIG